MPTLYVRHEESPYCADKFDLHGYTNKAVRGGCACGSGITLVGRSIGNGE